MTHLILVLISITLILLLWQSYRLWKILRDLANAVETKSSYLQSSNSKLFKLFRIDNLIMHYTKLLSQERRIKDLEYQMQNQIEAVLGNIQEAVCSIDQNNIIVHSNKAACATFNHGRPIRGKRIEELIRNPHFLNAAHLAKHGKSNFNKEISINIENEMRWFEISGTPIPKSTSNPYGSVIFVFHDITRLKELEIVKNNFVANVSHELKTPITIIKGFTEALIEENGTLPEATSLKFLKKIENNSERLHLIVQDLLTLSRIESEPEYLKVTPTRLDPLLQGIVENYASLLLPNQKLTLNNTTEDTTVEIDGFKISQVIQNLLDNAIRYSGEDSTISILVDYETDQRSIVISVADNGIGIPGEDIQNIFRRFYRVDKGRARSSGGTGLGLSIARGIVELHKGTIRAENHPEGGLIISFTLPQ